MTIINPSAQYRRNPLSAAEEFAAQEEARRQQQLMGATFQPAMQDGEQAPMSTTEAAYVEQPAVATTLQDTLSNLSDYGMRMTELERQKKEQNMRDRFIGSEQTQQGGQYEGPVAGVDIGELSSSRQQVLKDTASYAGTKYQLGGTTAKGIDCSGLVMAVYNKAGYDITQHSASWQGRNIPGVRTAVNNLQPGDLVAWKDGSHIAIYAGNGMIWDASSGKGTTMRRLWAPQSSVYGIKLRFPGD